MTVGRSTSPTHQIGAVAEQQAQAYLVERGFVLVAANVHCPWGEIDLVMQQGTLLVFVEVRARRRSGFASAAESVTPAKQKKLIRTAEWFLAEYPAWAAYDCRFDVIAVNLSQHPMQLDWIEAAFMLA